MARLDITIQQLTPGNGKIVSDDSILNRPNVSKSQSLKV